MSPGTTKPLTRDDAPAENDICAVVPRTCLTEANPKAYLQRSRTPRGLAVNRTLSYESYQPDRLVRC
jgi:hypothetical protein